MNSLNPQKPIQLMKPEGSLKVVVLNGSRQVDQVIGGEWHTLKVLPENGLPKGIYQLSDAQKPDTGNDGKAKEYQGALLHLSSKSAFQLCDGKIVEHERAALERLAASERPLSVGQYHGVVYLNGRLNSVSDTTGKSTPKKQDAPKVAKVNSRGHSL